VIVLSTVQALRDKFYQRGGSAADFRDETVGRLAGVWDALRAHTQATVLRKYLGAQVLRLTR